jgi:hypothetical protein
MSGVVAQRRAPGGGKAELPLARRRLFHRELPRRIGIGIADPMAALGLLQLVEGMHQSFTCVAGGPASTGAVPLHGTSWRMRRFPRVIRA